MMIQEGQHNDWGTGRRWRSRSRGIRRLRVEEVGELDLGIPEDDIAVKGLPAADLFEEIETGQ